MSPDNGAVIREALNEVWYGDPEILAPLLAALDALEAERDKAKERAEDLRVSLAENVRLRDTYQSERDAWKEPWRIIAVNDVPFDGELHLEPKHVKARLEELTAALARKDEALERMHEWLERYGRGHNAFVDDLHDAVDDALFETAEAPR